MTAGNLRGVQLTRGERAVQILAYPLNYYLSSADECPLARNQNPRRPRNTEAQKCVLSSTGLRLARARSRGGEIAFQDARESIRHGGLRNRGSLRADSGFFHNLALATCNILGIPSKQK